MPPTTGKNLRYANVNPRTFHATATNPRTCNAMKDKDDTHPCIDAATRGARQVHDVRKRHKNANQQKCCNGVYTRNDAVAEAFNGVN
jgi:hypothetical protein